MTSPEHERRLPLDGNIQEPLFHDPTAQQRQQFQRMGDAAMDTPPTVNIPYRLAMEIQEYIKSFADTCDYTLGLADREDMATDYVSEHLSHEVEPPSLAWDGLIQWRKIYGKS